MQSLRALNMDKSNLLTVHDESVLELTLGGVPAVSRMIHVKDDLGRNTQARLCPDYELLFLIDGECDFIESTHRIVAHAGDFLLFEPGVMLACISEKRYSTFHCHFTFGESDNHVKERKIDSRLLTHAHLKASAAGLSRTIYLPRMMKIPERLALAEQLAHISLLQKRETPGWEVAVGAQLLLILHSISDAFMKTLINKQTQSLSHTQVFKAIGFIDAHLYIPLSLMDVAQGLELHPAYLSRIFRQYTGQTVGAYILSRKLSIAKERLITKHESIKRVAALLGFSDPLYFSRQFRKATGMSPREYIVARA